MIDFTKLTGWHNNLTKELTKPYFIELKQKLADEYNNHTIYPTQENIFNAFNATPFEKVKVVILGQDPYHQPGQAHGLSFSVNDGIKFPKSLQNIFKELKDDIAIEIPFTGNLEKWSKQGVLLMNTGLTVRKDQANSHKSIGWQLLTDKIISLLGQRPEPIVFILWGKHAQEKAKFIANHHKIIESAHPSPLSAYRGFFGSKPFSKTNDFLRSSGFKEIDWKL